MKVERAIEILTPDVTRYTPQEYEEALRMARDALAYWHEFYVEWEKYADETKR